jgi:hypothetical protein
MHGGVTDGWPSSEQLYAKDAQGDQNLEEKRNHGDRARKDNPRPINKAESESDSLNERKDVGND